MASLWTLPDAGATEAAGAALAQALQKSGERSLLVLLEGDLGAGKTTLVRGLLRALGIQGPVPSPTYTLLEPYQAGGLSINHLDLYRLADASELEFLGWRDLAGSIRLVEWPERAAGLSDAADLTLGLVPALEGRVLRLAAHSDAGRRWLANIDSNPS